MTHSESLQYAALRSRARANRFRHSSMAETSELVETDVFPNDVINYLMKIFVGTPPVERWAALDTGSDLIWFQCSPCPQCNPQNAPFFDPKSSSTYVSLPCNSTPCEALPYYYDAQGQLESPKCGTSNECTYYYTYADNTYTMGELANESISFEASDGGQAVAFPNTVFGCGHNNNATYGRSSTGLVGLAQGSLSLVSQMGNVGRKFSYCLPPFGHQSTSKLRFGEDATISGNGVVSTPLITRSDTNFYFLNLEAIVVGRRRVPLTSQSDGNIFIDSGTTLTKLPSSVYNQVEALVKQAIGADQLSFRNIYNHLCYKNASSIQNVPNFMVHFTGEAELSLNRQNLFRYFTSEDSMCFAMIPTEAGGMPVYGNVAHINFEVQYDLDRKKLSFAPAECTKQ
ncbi:probable aspartic protease At2g35615 [Prosopis cineraria]|uniref:probable aspartic protease At2g35615 n=1 Tax=Prosopis cineraria TaxID=364024 RepID=UPI00241026C8|nr:probable aspartic protease At2g35615 [Prosopis cineraria]